MEETRDEVEDGSKSTIASTSANAAERNSQMNDANSTTTTEETGATSLDCPICLQGCVHPARLPCGHIFCFLCIKGVAYKNQRCAMCRREIPAEFLESPQLVNGMDEMLTTKSTEDGYQWFYEGRNGWWQYDVRTSQDIEDSFKKGEKSCTILVAGYVYSVDFEAMVQQRQTRCRRVKRDLANVPKKGIAGLRLETNNSNLGTENSRENVVSSNNRQNRNLILTEDASVTDFPHVVRQSESRINLASAVNLTDENGSIETDFNTFSSIIDLTTTPTQTTTTANNSFELEGIGNVFQNTIQSNNVRENENNRTDVDDFQETLNNLQQLTLRANDITQDGIPTEEEQENAYRNERC